MAHRAFASFASEPTELRNENTQEKREPNARQQSDDESINSDRRGDADDASE